MVFALGKSKHKSQHWDESIPDDSADGEDVHVLDPEEAIGPEETAPQMSEQKVVDFSRNSSVDTSRDSEMDLQKRFGSALRSALGPGTVIEGKFRFEEPVCIDGELAGEVASSSALIVGTQATVNAHIEVGTLIVLGNVTGDVTASEAVEIHDGGTLEGDIEAKQLIIKPGGFFQGHCKRK